MTTTIIKKYNLNQLKQVFHYIIDKKENNEILTENEKIVLIYTQRELRKRLEYADYIKLFKN